MTRARSTQAGIRTWLIALWAAVWLMVMIGGITRLTGSGLSMVEWRPVTGALPPMGQAAWQQAFHAYQQSPQFRAVNQWMSLADFQRIFFWEYVHRLFGRLLGVAFLVPWLWFVLEKRMNRFLALRTASILLLGGVQGAVGWYMVKSGLINEPRVSHYRLALHLLLGLGVGQWILWQALDLSATREPLLKTARIARGLNTRRALALGFLSFVILQIVYGAFMAGTRAGYLFATFPDMNGRYLPGAFFPSESLSSDLLSNPLSIHYVHRALALLVFGYACFLAYWLPRGQHALRAPAYTLLAAVVLQVLLGVLTVIWHMPIALSVAHQGGAYLLVSAALALCHAALRSMEEPDDPHSQLRARPGSFARPHGAHS